MDEILLRPVLALILPLALFVVLFLTCRKENTAVELDARYRLALIGSLAFLFWAMFSSGSLMPVRKIQISLLQTASVACAWGLAVTGWRLGVKKPVAAIVLTVLTTLSLGCWGGFWARQI